MLSMDVSSINGVKDEVPRNSLVYVPVEGVDVTSSIDRITNIDNSIEVTKVASSTLRISGLHQGDIVEVTTLDGVSSGQYNAYDTCIDIPMIGEGPIIVKVGEYKKIIL